MHELVQTCSVGPKVAQFSDRNIKRAIFTSVKHRFGQHGLVFCRILRPDYR
jgi:hypothetical protein